ncbi:MAG: lipid-binding SYLF domain-containing protein [Bryobacteraceae bacterium]
MKHSEQVCRGLLSALLIGFLAAPGMSGSVKDTRERLTLSATVMGEIMRAPDKGIPDEMLQSAHCVVVVPGLKKGAFIVSGTYGKGFVTCRRGASWSAPAAVRMEGGGVGFQIGGSETDVVMLVMNARGAERLMSSQFTLGGEGEVAAGPVGRRATAETDGKFTAEILSWSRSRGVFAGVALKGATLRADESDNADLYGHKMSTKEVMDAKLPVPAAGRPLIRLLSRNSPTEKK